MVRFTAKLAPHGRLNHLGGILRGAESTGWWGRAAMPANMSSDAAVCEEGGRDGGREGRMGRTEVWRA